MLWRSHEHHRDFRARLNASISTAAANHDQDRYIMITIITPQIQNAALCSRRPPIRHGGARSNAHLRSHIFAPIFIARGRSLRSQTTGHARQPHRPLPHGCRLHTSLFCRAQIPIAPPHDRVPLPAVSLYGAFFVKEFPPERRILFSFCVLAVSLFDLEARFFVPTRSSQTSARAEAVKVGRRANLAACSAACQATP